MKFQTAWSEIANQNLVLKIALTSSGLCAFMFSMATVALAMKEPLVVERSCYSTKALIADPRRTNEEIESFVKLSLEQRFDTGAKSLPGYLAPSETASRTTEQKELSSRQLTQKIVVNSVKIDGSTVGVDATRIVTVGTIRSALPLALTVKVESQDRNEGNPYGLLLASVKPTDSKETK